MPAFSTEAVDALADTFQGANGKDTYSNDKAMYGYIDPSYFMVVTTDYLAAMNKFWKSDKAPARNVREMGKRMAFAATKNVVADANTYLENKSYLAYGTTPAEQFDLSKMQVANYIKLIGAGMEPIDACAVASLRTRWMALGCLYTESDTDWVGNNSPFSEIVILANNDRKDIDDTAKKLNKVHASKNFDTLAAAFDTDDECAAFAAKLEDAVTGNSWTISSAEALWACVEYFYRTRGHHYKDEYLELAKKMYNSGFEGVRVLPSQLSPGFLFHTSSHPFGIKQLPIMTNHFALSAKLGHAYILRLEAAPNGLAVITTSAAALECLKSEPWWNAFYANMKESIDTVIAMAELILDDKYSYHMSANLYGVDKQVSIKVGNKSYTHEEAKSKASPVATVVQGFINYLTNQKASNSIKSFSLENAKSLEKHAAGNPVLTIKVLILCDIVSQVLEDTTDIKKASSAVFPDLKAIEVQKEAIGTVAKAS